MVGGGGGRGRGEGREDIYTGFRDGGFQLCRRRVRSLALAFLGSIHPGIILFGSLCWVSVLGKAVFSVTVRAAPGVAAPLPRSANCRMRAERADCERTTKEHEPRHIREQDTPSSQRHKR